MRYTLGAICGREPSLNTLDIKTPTPSNTPSNIPHATAEPSAERGPPVEKRVIKHEEKVKEADATYFGVPNSHLS